MCSALNLTVIELICNSVISRHQNYQKPYSFEGTTSFLGPMNPNKYPAIFRIWISSLPSVIRYLL